jgi:hypothetical protein
MMNWFGIERRKRQRRTSERSDDRRQNERRGSHRLAYPLAAAPEIMNLNVQVVGITAKAIRFFVCDFNPNKAAFNKDSKFNFIIKFHDGQIIKKTGTIIREDKYQEDKTYFIYLFDNELPQERIQKEEEYLLKNFPGFCNIIYGDDES